MPHAFQPNPVYYLLPLLLVVPLIIYRMRKMAGTQPLKIRELWVRPLILIVLAGVVIGTNPPQLADIPWLVLAAILGAAAGWVWGRTMAIHVHPEDGTLMTTGSQLAILVLVGLIVLRVGLNAGLRLQAEAWHIDVMLISDAFIVFAAFLFAVRGLEMFLRARKVMAEHQAKLPPPVSTS